MKKETGTKILWALTLVNTLILLSVVSIWMCRHHGYRGVDYYGEGYHKGMNGGPHHGIRARSIPDLIGTWEGTNRTVSALKGFKKWEKTVHITEQQDRRFNGNFTYADGTKYFSGVIYPGNRSFSWVSSDSKGYLNGRILGPDTISACYVESGEQSTAGCAELTRQRPGE